MIKLIKGLIKLMKGPLRVIKLIEGLIKLVKVPKGD